MTKTIMVLLLQFIIYLPMILKTDVIPHKAADFVGSPTCAEWEQFGADWWYSWNTGCGERCDKPQYPMVRDATQLAALGSTIPCDRPILGFNEPDNSDCSAGACMSLSELVTSWHELESKGIETLVSPSITKLTDYTPAYTLRDFVDAYRERYGRLPRVDIIALHFYGRFDVARSLEQWQTWYAAIPVGYKDRDVWVTELGWHDYSGCQNGEEQAAQFAELMLLDMQEKGVKYACWFGTKESGDYPYVVPLLRKDGTLTKVGEIWRAW